MSSDGEEISRGDWKDCAVVVAVKRAGACMTLGFNVRVSCSCSARQDETRLSGDMDPATTHIDRSVLSYTACMYA